MATTAWYEVAHPKHARTPFWLCIAANDLAGTRCYAKGMPSEPDVLTVMAQLVSPGDVVVDVGAHVGNHSIFLALVCKVQVEAFEPNPESFSYPSITSAQTMSRR